MSAFRYRPLSAENREIRLIKIQPGSDNTSPTPWHQKILDFLNINPAVRVYCTLIHVSLNDDIDFISLSYTWGDARKTKPVEIDSELFHVGENLEAALFNLQQGNRSVIIWADAICINQADNLEKSWQVQLMWDIYHKSKKVIVWLGKASDDSDLAIDKLNAAGKIVIHSGLQHLRFRGLQNVLAGIPSSDRKTGAMEKELVGKVEVGPEHDADTTFPFYSIRSLLGRPYWSRTWVLQEIAAARDVEFACGSRSIPIEVLNAALNLRAVHYTYLLRRLRKDPTATKWEILIASTPLDYRPYKIIEFWQMAEKQNLLSLMAELCLANTTEPHWYYATDHRDRIFALLSLVADADELGIRPDYSKSCIDVYTDFAKAFLNCKDLSILRFAVDTGSGDRIAGLPSWVADWTHLCRSPLRQEKMPHFSSCGSTEASCEVGNKYTLRIEGIRVDVIRDIGGPLKRNTVESIADLIRQFRVLAGSRGELTRYSDDQIQDAIVRTLISDMESIPSAAWRRATSEYVEAAGEIIQAAENGAQNISKGATRLQHRVCYLSYHAGRRLFITEKGYMGLGSPSLQGGDLVVIFSGGEMPFALRKRHAGGFHLIEECYVHGIMDGQLFEEPEQTKTEIFEIE